MKCPRCRKEAVLHEREGQLIVVCRECRGMWLHKNQLDYFLRHGGGNIESLKEPAAPDRSPVITCGVCGDVTMKKTSFLEYSSIIIDVCPKCGSFWLDRDELFKMKEYMRKVEEGSHQVRDFSAYNILTKLSELAWSLFK